VEQETEQGARPAVAANNPPAPDDHAVAGAVAGSAGFSSGGPTIARLAHLATHAPAPQPISGQAAVVSADPADAAPEPHLPESSATVATRAPARIEAPSTSAASAGAAQEPTTVGSIRAATECPRDWLNTAEARQPATGDLNCAETAAVSAQPGAEQRALEEAAADHASEIAALQFVPRIPVARPDPPPRPRKTGRKASWPADDPPNCGKKRARWRYVNDVPTWYCR
jgi:hypothetical protein